MVDRPTWSWFPETVTAWQKFRLAQTEATMITKNFMILKLLDINFVKSLAVQTKFNLTAQRTR